MKGDNAYSYQIKARLPILSEYLCMLKYSQKLLRHSLIDMVQSVRFIFLRIWARWLLIVRSRYHTN